MNKHQRQAIDHVLNHLNREVQSYEGMGDYEPEPNDPPGEKAYIAASLAAWTAARDAVLKLKEEMER